MRRSQAPSKAFHRPKFVSPLLTARKETAAPDDRRSEQRSDTLTTNQVCGSASDENKVLKRIIASSGGPVPDSHDNDPDLIQPSDIDPACQPPVPKKPRFCVPLADKSNASKLQSAPTRFSPPGNMQAGNQSKGAEVTDAPTKHYFSVVWCKRSSKKHKKWEGDAVLVTSGRSVTLYDIEGKEIGKSSGYKSTELLSLKEDETLPIGGKEIQVMSQISEEHFRSGKCFTCLGSVTGPSRQPDVKRTAFKQFSRPNKQSGVSGQVVAPSEPLIVKPRYDPLAPGALVMPRPSESLQWKQNPHSVPVVDVVVDPYLCVHLRPHQREGVTFLYECVVGLRPHGGHGAILADDMGLGKTLQCISLIWTLYKQGPYGGKPEAKKTLILTPGSLVKNWRQEFKKWLGLERLQVFAVCSDNKVEEYMKTSIYPVLIISYEMFVRVYDSLKKVNFDLIVCDEGHRLKNTAIKTSTLLMSLPTRRRVLLTGTPIQNDLQEFFAIVEFCNPGVLGSSTAFRRVYEEPILKSRQPGASPAEVSLGEERGAELARMTQMFVLRRTQEINNKYLPSKCDIVLFCRPSQLQLKVYQQLLRSQLIRSCLAGCLSGSVLVCIAALKQLCNHPSLIYQKAKDSRRRSDDELDTNLSDSMTIYQNLSQCFPADYSPTTDMEDNSGKLAVLGCLLHKLHTDNPREKIVLVANHTKTLDLIQCLCTTRHYQYLRLDGQTPTSKRQELVQKFNSKHAVEFIFLLSSKAGGVGLNLIGASRLVLYDIDWNPANDLQAMARVWRDGQKHKVFIYRLLITGSIEEKVYQRQISKQGLSGAILDPRIKQDVHFSLEDLRDLFSINLTTDCETHDLLRCDCIDKGNVAQTPVLEPTVSRSCQLGAPKTQKKNLGMDELMSWKHCTGSDIINNKAWLLDDAIDHISFVLHSEVKNNSTVTMATS